MKICGKPAARDLVRKPGGDMASVCKDHLEEMKAEWSRSGEVIEAPVSWGGALCGRVVMDASERLRFDPGSPPPMA